MIHPVQGAVLVNPVRDNYWPQERDLVIYSIDLESHRDVLNVHDVEMHLLLLLLGLGVHAGGSGLRLIGTLAVRVPAAVANCLGGLHGEQEVSDQVMDSNIALSLVVFFFFVITMGKVEEVEECTKGDEGDSIQDGEYGDEAELHHLKKVREVQQIKPNPTSFMLRQIYNNVMTILPKTLTS